VNNNALAHTGFAIIDGISVPPCGVTTLEALCYFGEPVTIIELEEQYEDLFRYSSWHAHLRHLEQKGLVVRSTETKARKRKTRVKWQITQTAREFIELVQNQ
jgi:DNA-binding MarR family transcriptional regulator